MIHIQQLHKSFGKNQVLKGIDLDLKEGGIFAVLGPNGSGKTTLLKCILGMVLPNQGKIHVQGEDIGGKWKYRNHIGYLPQIARFPENLRVRELIRMIGDIRGQETQADSFIERFDLQPFLDQRLGTLSGGTKQKVNLVQAFLFDCPILILDEPTTGLDPLAMVQLRELLEEERKRGKLILISSHIMSFVEEMADNILFLLDGHIHFKGKVSALKEQYEAPNIEQAIARILQLTSTSNPDHEKDPQIQLI